MIFLYDSVIAKLRELQRMARDRAKRQFAEIVKSLHAQDPYGSSALEKQMAKGYMRMSDVLSSYITPLTLAEINLLKWKEAQEQLEKARQERLQWEKEKFQQLMNWQREQYLDEQERKRKGGTILNPYAIASLPSGFNRGGRVSSFSDNSSTAESDALVTSSPIDAIKSLSNMGSEDLRWKMAPKGARAYEWDKFRQTSDYARRYKLYTSQVNRYKQGDITPYGSFTDWKRKMAETFFGPYADFVVRPDYVSWVY